MKKTQKFTIVLAIITALMCIGFLSTTVYATCDPTTSDSSCYTYDSDTNTYSLTADLTLTASWEITEDTIINLNGYTIKTTQNYAGDTIKVTQGATLTITGDGTITNSYNKDSYAALWNNGTVIIDSATFELNTETNSNTYYVIVNHGTMTIESATVTSDDYTSSMIENGYYSYTSSNERNGYCEGTNQCEPTLTINGGTFSGGLNTVKNDDNGILTINGGSFSNTTQVTIFNANVVTINDGVFDAPEGTACIATGSCGEDSNDKGIVTINGGTFSGPYLFNLCSWSTVVSNVAILGGIFNYTDAITYEDCDGLISITVTGGTYSKTDVIPEYDSDTYMLLDNEDGTYTVVLKASYDESIYDITTNEDGSVTVTEKDADYTEVEKAIAKAKALNASDYTEGSWESLAQALSIVEYGLKIGDQDTVDFYAWAIQDALDNLVKVDEEEQTEEPQDNEEGEQLEEDSINPKTGDMIILFGSILLIAVAGLIVTVKIRKRANK